MSNSITQDLAAFLISLGMADALAALIAILALVFVPVFVGVVVCGLFESHAQRKEDRRLGG